LARGADLSLCGEPCEVPSSLGWFCDDGTRRRLLWASPEGAHRGESSAANPGHNGAAGAALGHVSAAGAAAGAKG
jgi:hypothetical protein